jgi:hypothetical protein
MYSLSPLKQNGTFDKENIKMKLQNNEKTSTKKPRTVCCDVQLIYFPNFSYDYIKEN